METQPPRGPGALALLELLARIEGPFAGVDTLWVVLGIAILAAVIGFTAVVARQVAQLTPRPGAATKARGEEAAKAGAEFDSWTERPPAQRDYEADYYSLYGSKPARQGDYVSPKAPAAPSAPSGDVMATFGGPAAADAATAGWPAPSERAAAPRTQTPFAPPEPSGPSDEVVAPTHARGARSSAGADPWKNLGTAREAQTGFQRSSTRPGAAPPSPPVARTAPGQPAPRSSPPPARSSPPAAPGQRPGSARSAFRTPPGRQAVVGGAGVGAKEGDEVAPKRKAIRCPKCSTVFPGPEKRPATVKCPACGTGGVMK